MPSTLQPTKTFKSKLSFDETRWVIQILHNLEQELEHDEEESHVCIFNVPKVLMSSNPDSYTPHEVAIGPYRHWHPELDGMERYKIKAAKYFQKHLQNIKFQDVVVQHLMKYEQRIRACYHKVLDINGETLSWVMALDSSFLLEFLNIYAIGGHATSSTSSSASHLVDYAGTKAAHNAILRDIVMLENQIPLFVLRKMLELQLSSLELANDTLQSMLMGLCNELSSFKMVVNSPEVKVSDCAHLLDCLYQMLVPTSKAEAVIAIEANEDQKESMQEEEESFGDPSYVKQLIDEIWKLLSKLNEGPVSSLRKPLAVIWKLPWEIISKIPGASLLKLPAEYLFFNQDKEENKENSSLYNNTNNPPLMEEITIPSVTELSKCGVRFIPTNGGISSISFDANTATFYLPIVCLDVSTEVIFRNLVAYETSIALGGPLLITRYSELMNGIIDTEEDARILRENGIILNHLKSDLEVANLWNGMSKSGRLTRVPFLDKMIGDVNRYYRSRWKVKLKKTMKSYVYSSWRFLTLIASILLLLLMSLQAICSVYTCSNTLQSFNSSTE